MSIITLAAAVPEGRAFALDMQMFISVGIQLINACILAYALSRILYKPVTNILSTRAEKINGQLSKAEQDMQEAGRLREMYEAKLAEIDVERIAILDAARAEAAQNSKQLLDESRREVTGIKERAVADVQKERENLHQEMAVYILEVSMMMASKFISQTIDKETQDRIFREAIDELETVSWPH